MIRMSFGTAAALALALGLASDPILALDASSPSGLPAADPVWPDSAGAEPALDDTLDFSPPAWTDSAGAEPILEDGDAIAWETDVAEPRTPFGDGILGDADEWIARGRGLSNLGLLLDYDRVDQLDFGLAYQTQAPWTMFPRVGMRLEYSTGRRRLLYGVQVEQPLAPRGLLAIGASITSRTDHNELQQLSDVENTLAFLLGRHDWRDYFGREGYGAYLNSRLGAVTTAGIHLRNDRYRSLEARLGTQSLFHRDRPLRPNPVIDEGDAHRLLLRFERLAYLPLRASTGVYHWIELEQAGGDLGGDLRYTRVLGDLRTVIRLSPATALALRLAAGSGRSGMLPPQREFAVGGVDGLRAHHFLAFRGDQMALVQGEYSIGLWPLRSRWFEGGLHAIAFVDAGHAWSDPGHDWDPSEQRFALDGGFGLASAEDNLRIYFARNLRDPDSGFVISARLRRPF
jgi:surface antigen Omp85-like protein